MKYVKVQWHHEFPDEPVVMYSEIDDERWEVRKVEVFRDGHSDWADRDTSRGTSMLGEIPFPPLAEIAAEGGFTPEEIDAEQFEAVWRRALAQD